MLRQVDPKIVEYPESDGEPMGETGFHVALMVYVIGMLRAFFHHRSDAYVGGNMFLYYHEGDPRQCVSPDAFHVPKYARTALSMRSGATSPTTAMVVSSGR